MDHFLGCSNSNLFYALAAGSIIKTNTRKKTSTLHYGQMVEWRRARHEIAHIKKGIKKKKERANTRNRKEGIENRNSENNRKEWDSLFPFSYFGCIDLARSILYRKKPISSVRCMEAHWWKAIQWTGFFFLCNLWERSRGMARPTQWKANTAILARWKCKFIFEMVKRRFSAFLVLSKEEDRKRDLSEEGTTDSKAPLYTAELGKSLHRKEIDEHVGNTHWKK